METLAQRDERIGLHAPSPSLDEGIDSYANIKDQRSGAVTAHSQIATLASIK